jgi:hypothetical protein
LLAASRRGTSWIRLRSGGPTSGVSSLGRVRKQSGPQPREHP